MVGPHASPDAILTVATAAERLGFHCVSTFDPLLLPAAPGWRNVYGLPEFPAYDVLETLTWVAAHTRRIRLTTNALDSLFQPPIVLARRLLHLTSSPPAGSMSALDRAGCPRSSPPSAYPVAAEAPASRNTSPPCGRAGGPTLLSTMVRATGYRSNIGPKPVNGGLSVRVGGVARPAVERAARIGDGFILGLRDWDSARDQIDWYRGAGGTGPIVARAGPMLADDQYPTPPTTWTEPSVIDDLARAADEGLDEVHWDLNIVGLEPHRQVHALEALTSALGYPHG
jgi:hypothetical protein